MRYFVHLDSNQEVFLGIEVLYFFVDNDLALSCQLIGNLRRSKCCPQKTYSNGCGYKTPFPSLAPLSVEISLLPPKMYFGNWVPRHILFWTPKILLFLVLFVSFPAFLKFIRGESCVFQVFPDGSEKYIIDEFCWRYSLFWFDVSKHSKVLSPWMPSLFNNFFLTYGGGCKKCPNNGGTFPQESYRQCQNFSKIKAS